MKTTSVKRNARNGRKTPKARTYFEQIPVEIVKKKMPLEESSLKKPTAPSNAVAAPAAMKTEPYSMPLSSLSWTGH